MGESKAKTLLKECIDRYGSNTVVNAILMAMPVVGTPLKELLQGRRLDDAIGKVMDRIDALSQKNTNELSKFLEEFMKANLPFKNPILIIGGANTETILNCQGRVTLGEKHMVTLKNQFGGSGVNFCLRLLARNAPVLPILPIGNDESGKKIQKSLIASSRAAEVPPEIIDFIGDQHFLNSRMKTPTGTILISGSERTILAQELIGGEYFHDHMLGQLEEIETFNDINNMRIMIGHIQSDGRNAESTKHVIRKYANSFIYTVFGMNQIKHPIAFWEEAGVFDSIDVFQLNIEEVKRFFALSGLDNSLNSILAWFRNKKLSAVITMDKFGALGTYKDHDRIYVAWPLIGNDEVVDSTGAGDAFASGMLSALDKCGKFESEDFYKAMQTARVWASCACMHAGGTGMKPKKELEDFLANHPDAKKKMPEARGLEGAHELIQYIDLAYQ